MPHSSIRLMITGIEARRITIGIRRALLPTVRLNLNLCTGNPCGRMVVMVVVMVVISSVVSLHVSVFV